jgi:hypothetical protein
MAYASGDTITGAQYNVFVNSSSSPFGYNHFAGTGTANYGLGQTHIATVTGGDNVITAAQWNTLMTGLINIANHTNDSITARTQVTAGDSVAIKAAVEADLATLAASVNGGCTSATGLTTAALRTITTGSTGWDTSATHEHTITWASADTMRHYFNAGGKIRITTAVSGSVTGDKDTVFTDLGTGVGNLDINAETSTRSGSSETLATNGLANGFRDLGTGYAVILKLTSDNSGYTSNHVTISAKLNAAVGSAVNMVIKVFFEDGANDDTYTSPNTSGVPADPNQAPATTSTVSEIYPDTSQGLAATIRPSSTAETTNSVA